VIIGFQGRRLQRLYETGDRRRIPPNQVAKIEDILAQLDEARVPQDMNKPGFRLHPLSGDLAGFWSVSVSRNWRIIFRFDAGDVTDVDLVDYH
jgi:proteic killer suppression protein